MLGSGIVNMRNRKYAVVDWQKYLTLSLLGVRERRGERAMM